MHDFIQLPMALLVETPDWRAKKCRRSGAKRRPRCRKRVWRIEKRWARRPHETTSSRWGSCCWRH